MKKLICLAFLGFNLLANAQCDIILSCPEYAVFYIGYQNKVEVVCPDMKSSSISVSGGTVTKATWTDQKGISHSGYYVNVTSGVKSASVTLTGKDKKGKVYSYGRYTYKVIPFPAPQITSSTISKSSGMIANLAVADDCPSTGVSSVVTGGIIGDIPFSGKIVPAAAIENLRVGDQVGIDVFFTHNGEKSGPISAILTVVE